MSSENSAAGQLAAAAAAAAAAQSNSPQEQPAQPASAAQTTNNAAVGSDSHRCLWEGCSERFGGPEALYVSKILATLFNLNSKSQELPITDRNFITGPHLRPSHWPKVYQQSQS